jgi:flagellar assembly protein FliH
MASRVIPKEQLTAYQRWELSGLEGHGQPGGQAPTRRPEEAAVGLPTAEQVEQIHNQAREEGYKMGQEEGYKAGYEAGRQAAQKYAGQLADLARALDAERLRQDPAIAGEVLALALAVAKQMLRTALGVKDELVLAVIRDALNSLPSLTGHLRILLHPDDVETVREFMHQEHGHMSVRVAADARIERGGFRLESNFSEVDGQLPSRWQTIVECLGADDKWLE